MSEEDRGIKEDFTFSSKNRKRKKYEVEIILNKRDVREKLKYLVR